MLCLVNVKDRYFRLRQKVIDLDFAILEGIVLLVEITAAHSNNDYLLHFLHLKHMLNYQCSLHPFCCFSNWKKGAQWYLSVFTIWTTGRKLKKGTGMESDKFESAKEKHMNLKLMM